VRGYSSVFVLILFPFLANGGQRIAPFSCQDVARDFGSRHSLTAVRTEAAMREAKAKAKADHNEAKDASKAGRIEEADAKFAQAALGFCTAAELYKRLGSTNAPTDYQNAIEDAPTEPAFELFYGDYLRLYRGAGQRPLFPQAEKHLVTAAEKLAALKAKAQWDSETANRLRRSLTALYERDGAHLASRNSGDSDSGVRQPWLFFSPGVRLARSTDDFDQTSDIRDLTSAALFSQNCLPLNNPARRLCTPLSEAQLARGWLA
jgi:hypothetical protein